MQYESVSELYHERMHEPSERPTVRWVTYHRHRSRISDLERQLTDAQKQLKGRYDQISEQARTIADLERQLVEKDNQVTSEKEV